MDLNCLNHVSLHKLNLIRFRIISVDGEKSSGSVSNHIQYVEIKVHGLYLNWNLLFESDMNDINEQDLLRYIIIITVYQSLALTQYLYNLVIDEFLPFVRLKQILGKSIS